MKSLVIKPSVHRDDPPVTLNNVDCNKFFGVQQDYDKGFILKPDYDNAGYKVYCREQMTVGNSLWMLEAKSYSQLDQYIEFLMCKGALVYQFDTMGELGTWLDTPLIK